MAAAVTLFVKSLPSYKGFYSEFDCTTETDRSECVEGIKDALNTDTSGGSYFDKVNRAVCYVSAMYKHQKNTYPSKRCGFLYYWIGDMLSKNHALTKFGFTLHAICNAINNTYKQHGCEINCAPIGEDEFKERKIIYDFAHDFSNIKEYLQYYSNNHNTDFNTYIKEVQAATKFMDAKCGGTEGGYCNQFWPNHKTDILQKLSDLKSEIKSREQRTAEAAQGAASTAEANLRQAVRGATTTTALSSIFGTFTLTTVVPFLLYKEDWEQVPSYTNVYKKFDGADKHSCDANSGATDVIRTLKGKLEQHGNHSSYEESAVNNYCYAPKMEISNLSNKDDRCGFLYFWIGSQLCNLTNPSDKFPRCMNDVYEELSKINISNKCPTPHTDNITKDLFNHRKKVDDLSFDYQHIKEKLQHYNYSCDQDYYNHLTKAKEAFEKVLNDCQSKGDKGGKNPNNDDPYCSWFKNTYDLSNGQNPLILSYGSTYETTATTPPGQQVTVYKDVKLELNFASTMSPEVVAVSSGLAALGLPTIAAFFLYKYDLLPSWISNTFFGGGRSTSSRSNRRNGREGRSGARNWDTFTDNDSITNSTIGSTTQFYNVFDSAQWTACTSTIGGAQGLRSSLERKLNAYSGLTSFADKFMGAYCYACDKREQEMSDDDVWCQFFYHWIGKYIVDTNKGNSVSKVLGDIYDTLGTYFGENKCEITYKDVDADTFKHRKVVFDHYYNYTDVEKYLNQDDRDCLNHWLRYKQKVSEACTTVRKYCAEAGSSDQYCSWFNSNGNGEDYCGQKLQDLECTSLPEAAGSKQGAKINSSGVSIPAISSTVGTLIGIPVVAFLLYKHTPLFSGLRNHSFGHNNKRRKRGALRRNFDALTEYTMENSSTISSTTVDSTVRGPTDSSTLYSSPYTTASTRTGRTGRTPNKTQFYDIFKSQKGSTRSGCDTGMDVMLRSYKDKGVKDDEVIRTVCSAPKIEKQVELDWESSQFLYYHVGHELLASLADTHFNGLLNHICSKINDTYRKKGSKIPCDPINREPFNNRKTIFEYYHDYGEIWKRLQPNGADCSEVWLKYREGVIKACEAVNASCKAEQNYKKGDYCFDFNSKYKAYCNTAKLSELKCELESKLKAEQEKYTACSREKNELQDSHKSDLSAMEANLRSATTTSSISSIFGTLATIGAPFLLYKYFGMLRKSRKRYRRAYQVRGPSLEQQIVDHVDDQADGPHAYTLVKERKPRSTPIKKRKKRAPGRRMIIDIHFEVLDECQKGDLHSTKEDFFEIIVEEFMGPQFIKQENFPKEQFPSSDSGFREEDFVPKEEVSKKEVSKKESEYYSKFEEPEKECTGTCETEILKVIMSKESLGNYGEQIMKALRYAYEVYGKNGKQSNSEPYHFLYYWIGEKLLQSPPANFIFSAKMSVICGAMKNYCGTQQCKIPCDRPTEAIFSSQKKIFDGFYDYNAVMRVLGNGESPCGEKWSDYLKNVSLACAAEEGATEGREDPLRAPLMHSQSTDFYDKFENSQEKNCDDGNGCNDEIDQYNLATRGLNVHRLDISKALAYIYKEYRGKDKNSSQGGTPAECRACHFFYYWIWDELFKSKATSHDFLGMISTICQRIRESWGSGGGCDIPCESPNKEAFNSQKILFDYWHDHFAVRALLEFSGSEGFKICKSYIEEFEEAKGKVDTHCKTDISDEYCTKFWVNNKMGIEQALEGVKGTLATAQAASSAASIQLSNVIHQANKASSLSSAFGTLAALELPAVLFLLYKNC
ncbi:KIR protein [Plasmodium coatneyi]|uniref:KIR protein n=1 Tax=Plasmodium coatneyi TaxID=208452 RepID=A0A1B1E7F0_9APIC|nr:KIR protein [Plasmodium coatneyi]ANQ10689.1 KIR protein [Plasmodium coatneyi]